MFVIVAIITLKVWIVPYICFKSLIPRTVLSNQEDGGNSGRMEAMLF